MPEEKLILGPTLGNRERKVSDFRPEFLKGWVAQSVRLCWCHSSRIAFCAGRSGPFVASTIEGFIDFDRVR